ncbi:MAG: hypothetical protein LBP64_04510 [Tannerella sp.]|jgi:hypothetical protein|nr:hypothetical protein [Tannerella sp.]
MTIKLSSQSVIASNILFIARNILFIARNISFIARNILFIARNILFIARNILFIARNISFIARNISFIARNIPFIARNNSVTARNILVTAGNNPVTAGNKRPVYVNGNHSGCYYPYGKEGKTFDSYLCCNMKSCKPTMSNREGRSGVLCGGNRQADTAGDKKEKGNSLYYEPPSSFAATSRIPGIFS